MSQATSRRLPWTGMVFASLWGISTLSFAYQTVAGPRVFADRATLPLIGLALLCTAAFLWWLPSPPLPEAGAPRTRCVLFALAALGALVVLLALCAVLAWRLLLVLPAVALVVLLLLRPKIERREVAYASGLALVAGIAGLGHGRQPVPPVVWMALQVPLVFLGLLAGWTLLRRTGLLQAGLGRSLLLTEGRAAAAKGALLGMVLALPWAFLNIAMGGNANDQWARAWWAPLVALQPGIAEEAWGRVLLVPLLFLLLNRLGRARTALVWATIIAGYWFAYLHTRGSDPVSAIVGTLLMGTVYTLPLTYIWLCRGLEPAMGFHFAIDAIRFAAAFLINIY